MLPKEKHIKLAGWGNFPVQMSPVYRPERQREVSDIITHHPSSLIARGAGRSYGDASLNWEGVVDMQRLNRFLAFDTANGIMTVQSGVTLKEVMDVSIPLGWFPPVIPGTKYVTIGGCFACNVHGKNAYVEGEFAKHVASIKLRTSTGALIECSPQSEANTFWATAGGMGATGIIEEVTLQLKPIASSSMRKETFRTQSIDDLVHAFRQYADKSEYMVGWIDHFGKGPKFGKGVFESASHAKAEVGQALFSYKASPPPKPFPLPPFFLNATTMAFYNQRRFGKYKDVPKTEICGFDEFFHPLDKYSDWNKLYGSKGLVQYQFILPDTDDVAIHIQTILQTFQQSKQHSYLAVIKYHGAHQGMLSYGIKGFSVALDFPVNTKLMGVLDTIDGMVADLGGRIYLAKDARLKSDMFFKMYSPQVDEWMRMLAELDPERKMTSAMVRRLQMRGM